MIRSIIGTGLAIALVSTAAGAQDQNDPLLRPIASDYANRWLTAKTPARLFGNTYAIGFSGLNVALIDTGAGLVLIDGALPQAVRAIEANIRTLGFRIEDVKMILSTEPHYDHAGGLAALSRDTGAPVFAGAAAAPSLRSGQASPEDPQAAWLAPFPGVRVVKPVRDGQVLRLGRTAITAIATPGHTRGSTSWSWRSCEGRRCKTIVFASSINPVAADGYRFSDRAHAAIRASYARTHARLRKLSCDLLITAHPAQLGGVTPPPGGACRALADQGAKLFAQRLADERSGKAN